MTMSETPELLAALAKAQGAFTSAIKDVDNTFFKSKYADLSAVWEACRGALSEHSLFVSQQPIILETGQDALRTRVYHASGGFIESVMKVVTAKQNDPQSFGSAMTYTRRYSLAAILNIVTDDDDAEGAMNRGNDGKATKAPERPKASLPPAPEAPKVEAATAKQKEEIIKLLTHPLITKEEKAKMLENLGKLSTQTAVNTITNIKKKHTEREQVAREELHDLITTHSEVIGDDLVSHYMAALAPERGIADVVDALEKVKFGLSQAA